jgi:hypothetical protein
MPYRLKGKKGVGRLRTPYRLKNYGGDTIETLPLMVHLHWAVRPTQVTAARLARPTALDPLPPVAVRLV